MSNECKVCVSEKREYIEQLILQGNSNLTIAATLKDMNENISHASINRHKTKHMIEYAEIIKANKLDREEKDEREDSKNAFIINANEIYNEIKSKAVCVDSYYELTENNNITRLMLDRILNNQLAITIDLQEKYMQGQSKYPIEQLRGLQIIQDMVQKYDECNRKHFSHCNSLMNSAEGIKKYVILLGKKAKEEINDIKPYKKGMLFTFLIDNDFQAYCKQFNPPNPYTKSPYSDIEKIDEHGYFVEGIEKGRNLEEKLDVKLYEAIEDVYINYEILPEKDMEKVIKHYSNNEYDAEKEIRKYAVMMAKRLEHLEA